MNNPDSCVINREELSLREKDLKNRLFGSKLNNFQPMTSQPKTYVDDMAARKQKKEAGMADKAQSY